MGIYKPLRTWVDLPIPYGNHGSLDRPDRTAICFLSTLRGIMDVQSQILRKHTAVFFYSTTTTIIEKKTSSGHGKQVASMYDYNLLYPS